jgi:hypothetical protein
MAQRNFISAMLYIDDIVGSALKLPDKLMFEAQWQ